MKPESWTAEGNGVLFLVGVSDGKRFDELFRQHVNPFGECRRQEVGAGVGGPVRLRR